MLPCTKSYVSISILKQMLACHVCNKRVQNPHSYTGCEDHFFCLSCKGDGIQCPVCSKSLNNSELIKDLFLDDILKTSCFTTHDKDFEREKVPIHLVKELLQEFEKIDKIRLDGFAAKNELKSPLKANKENEVLKISSQKTVQTKLNFLALKTENEKKLSNPDKTNNSFKQIGLNKNETGKSRNSRNFKSKEGLEENSSRKKSLESAMPNDYETMHNASNGHCSLSKEPVENKLNSDASSDSQSIFKNMKPVKKLGSKIQNESKGELCKKTVKSSKTEVNSEEEKLKEISETGPEKKKSRQSVDSSKIGKTETGTKRRSKDNCDKSVLEKDKKVKNIFKKNAKGETALHIACRKNEVNTVKELLETDWKLHINDKDFAGWTPLHEAVFSGNCEISKMLLEAGAWVFVPGDSFETPLHTALYKTEELVRLLMQYGPDIEARTIIGTTPLSIAKEKGLENLLECSVNHKLDLPIPPPSNPTVIYLHDQGAFDKSVITSLNKLDITVAKSYSKDVSHLVIKTNDNNVCESSIMVLEAMLLGKFLLNTKWVNDSIDAGKTVQCEQYEITGVGSHTGIHSPYKARLNAYRLFPGLFAGAFFYLVGNWRDSTKREQISALINLGGSTILKREPDPENIPVNERTVMFHAHPNAAMGKCSHILLYNEESDAPKIKYRMDHIKTLPLKWLFACIETFSIVDPE